MTFDINAGLGQFALRRIRNNTAEGLLALMQRKGIDRALVSAAQGIMWKDCHEANRWLSDEIQGHADSLVGCAVINPAYAGWERDLSDCAGDMGFAAVKLYPHWHGYQLDAPCVHALATAAGDLGLPVVLPVRAVDRRQLGWLFDVPDLPLDGIADLSEGHPRTSFIVVNGLGFVGSRLATDAANLPGNYWIGISRLPLFIGGELPRLLAALGAGRLMFGTGMPFKYVDPVTLKLSKIEASLEDVEAIRGGNARSVLGCDVSA